MRAVLAGIFLLGSGALETMAQPAPAFVESACHLPGTAAVRCGSVSVARDPRHPESGVFRLAVVVIPSQLPTSGDPVLYISGGPGAPLTVFAGYQATHPLASGHDLILVDQRGTGRSEPELCADLEARLLGAEVDLVAETTAASRAGRGAAYADCQAEAIAHGLDLADFGTTVTVEDLDAVRRALGIGRWSLFGVSYGTTVAMAMMATHPETLDAVVLDSIYPPEPAPPWSEIVGRARDAFFAAHPGLADGYAGALARLERAPPLVAVPPLLHRPGDTIPLTRSLFEVLVARLIYYPQDYPRLLALIPAVQSGATGEAEAALAGVIRASSQTGHALDAAVQCRDRRQFRAVLPEGSSVLDRMELNDVCAAWSEPGPQPPLPSASPVPTLVLSGEFDPVSGPVLSHAVAGSIGARWLEVMGHGHSVRSNSACAAGLVAAFIDQPRKEFDASCAKRE